MVLRTWPGDQKRVTGSGWYPESTKLAGGRAAEAGKVAEEVTVADSIRKIVGDELTDVPEAKTASLREKLEGILKNLARHVDDARLRRANVWYAGTSVRWVRRGGRIPESGNHIVVSGQAADSIYNIVSQLTKSPNKMKADPR